MHCDQRGYIHVNNTLRLVSCPQVHNSSILELTMAEGHDWSTFQLSTSVSNVILYLVVLFSLAEYTCIIYLMKMSC